MTLPFLRRAEPAATSVSPTLPTTPRHDHAIVDHDRVPIEAFLEQLDWQLDDLKVSAPHRREAREAIESHAESPRWNTYEDAVDDAIDRLNEAHPQAGYRKSGDASGAAPGASASTFARVAAGAAKYLALYAGLQQLAQLAPAHAASPGTTPAASLAASPTRRHVERTFDCTPTRRLPVHSSGKYHTLLSQGRSESKILDEQVRAINHDCRGHTVSVGAPNTEEGAVCMYESVLCADGTTRGEITCHDDSFYMAPALAHEFEHVAHECRGITPRSPHDPILNELHAVSVESAVTEVARRGTTPLGPNQIQHIRHAEGFRELVQDGQAAWKKGNEVYDYLALVRRSHGHAKPLADYCEVAMKLARRFDKMSSGNRYIRMGKGLRPPTISLGNLPKKPEA